jgi:NAD(P)-dependent dehydrogenase (short-subunit alcohol dehydrogenase family)
MGLCAGRVAIVTGAGRGVGREYALMLAAEGAKVVVNDMGSSPKGEGQDAGPANQVVEEVRAAGGEAIVNGADVSDWDAARAMIDQAISTFGRLDILVNNAGILRDRMMVNMTEAEWDDVIRVHLKGTFAPSHHAANHWRAQFKKFGQPTGARLINNVGQSNYGAAKAGIAAFTVITSMELAQYGVTVNAVSPRAETRLTQGIRQRTEEEIRRRNPRWVAPIIAWLASEQSGGVTGRVFEAGDGTVAVAEGWVRGPEVPQVATAAEIGPLAIDMAARARRNADMWGRTEVD